MTTDQETGRAGDWPGHWGRRQGLQHHLVHRGVPEHVPRLEQYCKDAERTGDQELVDFFRRAQDESGEGAERGKELLAARLARS